MSAVVVDIETNYAHDTIWCSGVCNGVQSWLVFSNNEQAEIVNEADEVVGHNIIGFDAPVLNRIWGVPVPLKKMVDTLVLSRLYDPSRLGGHSLESWGIALGHPKGNFNDFDGGYTTEMGRYCINDAELGWKVFQHLRQRLDVEGFSPECIAIEHEVAAIIAEQERNGFCFEYLQARQLLSRVEERMKVIEDQFQALFPPRKIELYSIATKKPMKLREEVFNPGSRQQVVEKLFELGVGDQLEERTETGRYKLSETVLEKVESPEAALVVEYLTLQKRRGLIQQWLAYCGPDGRIHGKVITNGAITGRMTHAKPNMAQVPAAKSYLGKECRSLFTVPKGKTLVGIDASGLELRMLAHYMRDDAFTKSVVEGDSKDGTDVHSRNQAAAGLPDRDTAKTFIYALLYGAGPKKIGSIVGGGYAEGQELLDRFMRNLPALRRLLDKVERLSRSGTLDGLDGRKLRVRHAHAALNTLLQGAGAIVMKVALIIFNRRLKEANIDAKFVANVHDEWQLEVAEEQAELVAEMGRQAIADAGVQLGLRCPLKGDAHVGNNWSETH